MKDSQKNPQKDSQRISDVKNPILKNDKEDFLDKNKSDDKEFVYGGSAIYEAGDLKQDYPLNSQFFSTDCQSTLDILEMSMPFASAVEGSVSSFQITTAPALNIPFKGQIFDELPSEKMLSKRKESTIDESYFQDTSQEIVKANQYGAGEFSKKSRQGFRNIKSKDAEDLAFFTTPRYINSEKLMIIFSVKDLPKQDFKTSNQQNVIKFFKDYSLRPENFSIKKFQCNFEYLYNLIYCDESIIESKEYRLARQDLMIPFTCIIINEFYKNLVEAEKKSDHDMAMHYEVFRYNVAIHSINSMDKDKITDTNKLGNFFSSTIKLLNNLQQYGFKVPYNNRYSQLKSSKINIDDLLKKFEEYFDALEEVNIEKGVKNELTKEISKALKSFMLANKSELKHLRDIARDLSGTTLLHETKKTKFTDIDRGQEQIKLMPERPSPNISQGFFEDKIIEQFAKIRQK